MLRFVIVLLGLLLLVHTSAALPTAAGCTIFTAADEWNKDITTADADPLSPCYIASQFAGQYLRLDFGVTEQNYGIPWTTTNSTVAKTVISYHPRPLNYSNESDIPSGGQSPIPANAPIEGGTPASPNPSSGDRHVICIDTDNCILYELYNTERTTSPAGFRISSSAIFDLKIANNKRPDGWTSGDAAGLPIFPGLLRYEEASGPDGIQHAIRFTVPRAPSSYVYPGNHFGSFQNLTYPPYGTKFRLRADWLETPYTGAALAIVRALKKYGMIFADQGSAIYLSGVTNPGWSSAISQINQGSNRIPGDAFVAVKSSYTVVYDDEWNTGPIECARATTTATGASSTTTRASFSMTTRDTTSTTARATTASVTTSTTARATTSATARAATSTTTGAATSTTTAALSTTINTSNASSTVQLVLLTLALCLLSCC